MWLWLSSYSNISCAGVIRDNNPWSWSFQYPDFLIMIIIPDYVYLQYQYYLYCRYDQRSRLCSVVVILVHDSNLSCSGMVRNINSWSCLSSVSVLSSVALIISSTRPRNLDGRSRTWRLEHKKLNRAVESGLVRRSASWSRVDRNLTSNFFLKTRSLTKWKSISMCFVRAWNTRFEDKYVAPILSHQRVGLLGEGQTKFDN